MKYSRLESQITVIYKRRPHPKWTAIFLISSFDLVPVTNIKERKLPFYCLDCLEVLLKQSLGNWEEASPSLRQDSQLTGFAAMPVSASLATALSCQPSKLFESQALPSRHTSLTPGLSASCLPTGTWQSKSVYYYYYYNFSCFSFSVCLWSWFLSFFFLFISCNLGTLSPSLPPFLHLCSLPPSTLGICSHFLTSNFFYSK